MQIKCENLPGRWRSETSSCLRRSGVPACLRLCSGRGWRNKTAGWRPGEPVMGSAPWCSLVVSLCLCARFCPCLCSLLILFSPVLTSLPGSAPLLLLQAGYCFRVMVMMQGGRGGGGGWGGGGEGDGGGGRSDLPAAWTVFQVSVTHSTAGPRGTADRKLLFVKNNKYYVAYMFTMK